MKHQEIFDKVKPGTTIYSTAQGHFDFRKEANNG